VDAGLLLLLFLIVLVVAIAVLAPLRQPREDRDDASRSDRLVDLELRKEGKYAEIRDAEADFHAGKLSESDYRELDRALRGEAIAILEQIDSVNGATPRGGEGPS
jgi:hypothetical protein